MYYIRISGDCQRQDSIKRGEKPHRLSAIRLLQRANMQIQSGNAEMYTILLLTEDAGPYKNKFFAKL